MGKLIDVQLYADALGATIEEQKRKYAGDKVMLEIIDLLEIARAMALNQPAAMAMRGAIKD